MSNYAPYGGQPPTNGELSLPPNKRQRLDSYPGSPYTGSPTLSSPQGPPQSAHSPLSFPPFPSTAPNQSQHSPVSFHAPQSYNAVPASRPAAGTMGPPQRPAEKSDKLEKADRSTDINEISDVMAVSGVDLREEENYLTGTYRNQHGADLSFNTQSSATLSPNTSFNVWSQRSNGFSALQGAGQLNQNAGISEKDVERSIEEKYKRAARAFNEHQAIHLNDPFLYGNTLRKRLHDRGLESGVRIDVNGLYDRKPELTFQNQSMITGTGPNGAIISAQASSIVMPGTYADILTILSLATQERIRGVVEDSYALTRARQIGSNGDVPPDWASLAVGDGATKSIKAIQKSVSNTAWDMPDSAISPGTIPGKGPRSPNAARLPTPPTDPPPTPQPTISFSSTLAIQLRTVATTDRKHEEARIAARTKRRRLADSGTADSPSTPGGASTPNPTSLIAPETKMTKKERDKLAKQGQTEEVLHRAANSTANMQFGKKSKYSWMSTAGSGASTPSRINTNVGGVAGSPGPGGVDKDLRAKEQRWGEFREDGLRGKKIQFRDVVRVLEADGLERKTVCRAWARDIKD
ncbi:hypothetical protein M501DRAFT_947351 [Patellaria atrata CBS 101060]|uniref:Transcription initiation factor TFIID subunit 4 n=1 Tax=Patellaria atrata CBS 101060 TaxID=1346257 RepID=A0A9P4VTY7_9PEZI|nr:hypothetical protein M501DRAFT_947351 [Patellaria atrata CBS 101060]